MDERYARAERLTRQVEIDACYKQGLRLSGRILRLHVKRNNLPHARLAVSVPSRVCGAVERSRWKRLLREAFRRNKREIGAGIDIVAVPTRPPEALKRQDVEEALLGLLRKRRL